MLLADQNAPNNNLSQLLSSCSHLPTTKAYEKIVSFLKTHYDPRDAKNLPALFSALTQIVSALGGREIQTMAAQNAVMAIFASVSTAIVNANTPLKESLNVNQPGNHASWNSNISSQGVQLQQVILDAIRDSEKGTPNEDNLIRDASESNTSTVSSHHARRINSSSTVESQNYPIRSTDTEGWSIYRLRSDSVVPAASKEENTLTHSTLTSAAISAHSGSVKEKYLDKLRTIGINIAKERFFDLMLFAIACGYKYADGPMPLSAKSTNALVWDLLSSSQQGLAQALSYIMYRNYTWAITVLCSMATKVIELMNNTPDASTKAIFYAAMLGMVVGTSMIAINYMEHETVLAAGTAERPNQKATDSQREHQKNEFESQLNSWEKVGSYPGIPTACQDPSSENKDMFSGHVSALVVQAFSIYQLTRAIAERYPNNLPIKYLRHTLFAIGCAFAGETATTRVLGDCHTLESVMIASTKFNSPAIIAEFFCKLLDLAITNPKMFVTAARAIWGGLSKEKDNSLTKNMALNNERPETKNPVHLTNVEESKSRENVTTV